MITSKQCFDRFGQLRKKTWIAIYEFMHWELVIDLIKQVLQTYKQVTGKCYGRAKIEHSCHLCRFNNFFSLALWLLQSHKGKDVCNNINRPSITEHPISLSIAYNTCISIRHGLQSFTFRWC